MELKVQILWQKGQFISSKEGRSFDADPGNMGNQNIKILALFFWLVAGLCAYNLCSFFLVANSWRLEHPTSQAAAGSWWLLQFQVLQSPFQNNTSRGCGGPRHVCSWRWREVSVLGREQGGTVWVEGGQLLGMYRQELSSRARWP